MSYKVFWTEEYENTFNENLEYLSESWDETTILNFLERVDEIIENIVKNPKLYPIHRQKTKV